MAQLKVLSVTERTVGHADPTSRVTYHLSDGTEVVEHWDVWTRGKEILAQDWQRLKELQPEIAEAVMQHEREMYEMESDPNFEDNSYARNMWT